MFLKRIDILSPPITLFYKGENSHPSIFSGILSFLAYGVCIAFFIYYAMNYINRESPTAFFFNRYVENAGEYPVNASSMFNFIQVLETTANRPRKVEFDAVRVIGLEETIDNYAPFKDASTNADGIQKTITDYDHWLYGYCNNDTDTKGISYLINQEKYLESACIRYYYKKDDKKYYATNEAGFRWPDILYGCSHPDRTFYGIVMERCEQDAAATKLGVTCKDKSYIDEYIRSSSINYLIIDHYADVLNYNEPFTKYFYTISNGLFLNSYTTNHLNFNPALMRTHNGIFFENIVETPAYFFDQNEKVTESETVNGVIVAFYFWMQNRMQYYERNYKRLQDVLSDIGGIASIVMLVAVGINYIVSRFIILLDTEELVLDSEEKNFSNQDGQIIKKPTFLRQPNEIASPPKRQVNVANSNSNYYDYSRSRESSNYQRLMKDGVEVAQNNQQRDEKNEQFKNLYLKKNNMLNSYFQGDNDNNPNNNDYNNNAENRGKNQYNQGSYQNQRRSHGQKSHQQKWNMEYGNNKNIEQSTRSGMNRRDRDDRTMVSTTKKDDDKPLEKAGFNFGMYLKYVICCFRNNDKIKYYEEFRGKIISEETLMQNNLDIYKMKKMFEQNNPGSKNIS